jgi:DUF1680 family protein
VESADNGKNVNNLVVPPSTNFTVQYRPDLLGGINTIQFTAPVISTGSDGIAVTTVHKQITAIPYFTWNNRGKCDMKVWLPEKVIRLQID